MASARSLSGVKVGAGLSVNPYSYSPKGDREPSVTDGYHIFVSYPFAFTQRSAVNVGLRWEQTFNYKQLNSVKDTVSNNGQKIASVNMFNKEFDGDQLNKFDIALGGEIGYDWEHSGVSLGYDYGLIKGIKGSANSPVNFNRQAIRLSVAYIF